MGKLRKFISRTIGTPSTTAKWAAMGFNVAQNNQRLDEEKIESIEGLKVEVDKICIDLIIQRSEYTSITKYESIEQEREILLNQFTKTSGVLGLCISILQVEADLHKNTEEAIKDMVDVIYEVLIEKGIDQKYVFGDDINKDLESLIRKLNVYYSFSKINPMWDFE